MKSSILKRGAAGLIGGVGLSLALLAAAQPAGTGTPQGPTAKALVSVDLAQEMSTVEGKVLRMQLTTYAPGASNKEHSHKERPEVVYMLSGRVIEHRGDVAREYGPGDSFTADRNTVHWFENRGSVPAVLLVSTIVKP